jgi:hypothetical protein
MARALVALVALLAVAAGPAQARKITKRSFTGSVQVTQASTWDETYQDYDQAASCSRTVHRNGTQKVTLANQHFRVTVKRAQGLWTFLVPSSARVSGTVDRQRTMAYVGDDGQCTGPPPPIESDCGQRPLSLAFFLVAGNKVTVEPSGFASFQGTFQHCGYPASLSFLEAFGSVPRTLLNKRHAVMHGHKSEPIQTTYEGTGTVTLDWTLSLSR